MKIKKRYPSELTNFRCNGCGECCKAWSINIDPITFKKYEIRLSEKIEGLEYPFFFEVDGIQHFKLYDYSCVFLLKDKKCYIHKNLGSEYKCRTCAVYPKLEILNGGFLDISLTFSCSAAVEILFSPKTFSIKSKLINAAPGKKIKIKLLDDIEIDYDLYNSIEIKIIDFICNNNAFSFEKKGYLISFWLRSFYEKVKESGLSKLSKLVKKSVAEFDEILKYQEELAETISAPPSAQFAFIISILNNSRVFYGANREKAKKDFFDAISKLFDFLKIDLYGGYRPSVSVRIYKDLYEKYFFYSEREYSEVLKKYLLYNFFGKRFMLNYDIIRGFNMQLTCIVIIRLIAFASAEINNSILTSAHLADSIRFIERNFMHANRIFTFWSGKESETSINTAPFSKIIFEKPILTH